MSLRDLALTTGSSYAGTNEIGFRGIVDHIRAWGVEVPDLYLADVIERVNQIEKPDFDLAVTTGDTYATGVAVALCEPNTQIKIEPVNLTGENITWAVDDLPGGLTMDMDSGAITGTVPNQTGSYNLRLTATNLVGSTSKTMTLNVAEIRQPPKTIAYAKETFRLALSKDVHIAPVATDRGYPEPTWSISPALPVGLSFGTGTGEITGEPTAIFSQEEYTVTAQNTHGTASTRIQIEVIEEYSLLTLAEKVGYDIRPVDLGELALHMRNCGYDVDFTDDSPISLTTLYELYDDSTVEFNVTAEDGKFKLNGLSGDFAVQVNKVYRFDLGQVWNPGSGHHHPFRISHVGEDQKDRAVHEDDVDATGSYLIWTPPSDAPVLYYYCLNHRGMGGRFNVSGADAAVVVDSEDTDPVFELKSELKPTPQNFQVMSEQTRLKTKARTKKVLRSGRRSRFRFKELEYYYYHGGKSLWNKVVAWIIASRFGIKIRTRIPRGRTKKQKKQAIVDRHGSWKNWTEELCPEDTDHHLYIPNTAEDDETASGKYKNIPFATAYEVADENGDYDLVVSIKIDPDSSDTDTVSIPKYGHHTWDVTINGRGRVLRITHGDSVLFEDGEPPDTDGDGVGDNADAFPNDPTKHTDSNHVYHGSGGDPYVETVDGDVFKILRGGRFVYYDDHNIRIDASVRRIKTKERRKQLQWMVQKLRGSQGLVDARTAIDGIQSSGEWKVQVGEYYYRRVRFARPSGAVVLEHTWPEGWTVVSSDGDAPSIKRVGALHSTYYGSQGSESTQTLIIGDTDGPRLMLLNHGTNPQARCGLVLGTPVDHDWSTVTGAIVGRPIIIQVLGGSEIRVDGEFWRPVVPGEEALAVCE